MKIGVFDSGIGGINILKQLLANFPTHEYIYYADTSRAPYGKKTESEIKSFAYEAVEFLINQGAEVVIIACNTATKVAYKALKQDFPHIHLIGIEPPIREALKQLNSPSEQVLVFATPVTINNILEDITLVPYLSQLKLYPVTHLVTLAEEGHLTEEQAIPYLEKKCESLLKNPRKEMDDKYKSVLLGCTHFPFFKSAFHSLFPKQFILDGTANVLSQLEVILKDHPHQELTQSPITFFKDRQRVPFETFQKWIDA